jgi:hypothetical protein
MMRHAIGLLLISLSASPLLAQSISWWEKDFEGALAAAKDTPSKLVLLYCWQDNHDTCAAMFDGTLSNEKVAKPLADFVCMGIRNDEAGRATWQRYNVASVPTVIFINTAGDVVDLIRGYVTIDEFLTELARIREDKETMQSLRTQFETNPEDLNSALKLVQKLRLAGDNKASLEVIDAMIKVDPKGKRAEAAEAMLWKINDETFAPEIAPKDYDLTKLRRFLKSQRNKRILFLGYDRMATAEYMREDLKASAAAAMKAWKSIPDDQVIEWGQRMSGITYRRWKEFDKANKSILKNALNVSKKTLAAVKKRDKKQPDPTFLGNAMYLHAAMLIVNKKRKDALALMSEAMTIDPKNENLKLARENWVKGNK